MSFLLLLHFNFLAISSKCQQKCFQCLKRTQQNFTKFALFAAYFFSWNDVRTHLLQIQNKNRIFWWLMWHTWALFKEPYLFIFCAISHLIRKVWRCIILFMYLFLENCWFSTQWSNPRPPLIHSAKTTCLLLGSRTPKTLTRHLCTRPREVSSPKTYR